MVTYSLRPDFLSDFGPGGFRQPRDPRPARPSFERAYTAGQQVYHEDWLDRLNPDRTWGSTNPGETSGSGIVFGYAWDDLEAVVVAERAMRNTVAAGFGPNAEHAIRQRRWAMTAWEMTHDPLFQRVIINQDQIATGAFSETGMIHLDDPGWIPDTLAQFHAMARQRPHTGLKWNAREVGWRAYGRLMRHKVDRHCTRAWIDMLLETCALAAVPGTGQQVAVNERGCVGITSTFHEAILIHSVLIACIRFHLPIPTWVLDWMCAILHAPRIDYYGWMSPVRFWATSGGRLEPADVDTGNTGDPGLAYWQHNCVALDKLDPRGGWLDQARLIGPTVATDEASRQYTMLLRGAAA